jgi:hypothetical protein
VANLNYRRGLVNPRTSTGGAPETVSYQVSAAYATSIYIGDVVKIHPTGNAQLKIRFDDTVVADQTSMTAVSLGHSAASTASELPVVVVSPNIIWEVQSSFASGAAGQTLVGAQCTFTRTARHNLLQVSGFVETLADGTIQIVSLGSRPDNETASTDANPVVRVRFATAIGA